MSVYCRSVVAFLVGIVFASAAQGQEVFQPGPEHQKLMESVGTWDAVMKLGEMESKGVMTLKKDLNGLWISSEFVGEFAGQKFSGKGFDGYDPVRKKYVSVWVDSMSPSPMLSEGTFDKDGKVLTMTGEGPGPDGSPAKFRMTTDYKDKDTMVWTMFLVGPDDKGIPMFSISYKRRK